MEKEYATRIKLLKIWEILTHYSSADEPISSMEILAKLEEANIPCDRRTLYSDIELLSDCGYPVKTIRKKTNMYYTDSTKFTIIELKAMVDAIERDKNVPISLTKKLVEKLYLNAETEYKNVESVRHKPTYIQKAVDVSLFENLATIEKAIEDKKKLTFETYSYNLKKEKVSEKNKRTLSPKLVFSDQGNYYLVCSEKLKNIEIFNVEDMFKLSVSTEKQRVVDISNDKLRKLALDKLFGKKQAVTFICENSMIKTVIDKFGFLTNLSQQGINHFSFTVDTFVNDELFAWVLASQGKITINAPVQVKNNFKKFVEDVCVSYLKK